MTDTTPLVNGGNNSNHGSLMMNNNGCNSSRRRRSSIKEICQEAIAAAVEDPAETTRTIIRRTSSVVEQELPQTPQGWTVFVAFIASAIFGYELQLQKQLTCPPYVFFQQEKQNNSNNNDQQQQKQQQQSQYQHDNQIMQTIYKYLTRSSDSILRQPIQPSLWVGTRSALSTSLSVVLGHPHYSEQHLQFREIVTIPIDGATLALDWEAPKDIIEKEMLLKRNSITKPIVLILHGINNDSKASYIKSLQRTISNRGHIAIGMNFRGCGGHVPLTTPRPYTGAYTGDLRCVVYMLQGRLKPGVPLFLVGNSLGANLITKYLGEEGLNGTLPSCVIGGVSLANPLHIHSKNIHTPMAQLMALGIKLAMLSHWKTWKETRAKYDNLRKASNGVLMANTIGQVDKAMCSILLRNDPFYPYTVRIGYDHVEDYWKDCSSYRVVQHISVPLLQIIAGDDTVVYHSFQRKLAHCSLNPYIMSVETKCGGHLGWQESPPTSSNSSTHDHIDDDSGFRPTWAGRATADFIDAVLKAYPLQPNNQTPSPPSSHKWEHHEKPPMYQDQKSLQEVPILQSRL